MGRSGGHKGPTGGILTLWTPFARQREHPAGCGKRKPLGVVAANYSGVLLGGNRRGGPLRSSPVAVSG